MVVESNLLGKYIQSIINKTFLTTVTKSRVTAFQPVEIIHILVICFVTNTCAFLCIKLKNNIYCYECVLYE